MTSSTVLAWEISGNINMLISYTSEVRALTSQQTETLTSQPILSRSVLYASIRDYGLCNGIFWPSCETYIPKFLLCRFVKVLPIYHFRINTLC